jgi:uncharacterized protein (DUF58 family)
MTAFRPTRRALALAGALGALAVAPVLGGDALWLGWATGVGALLMAIALDAARLPDGRQLSVSFAAPAELHPGVPVDVPVEVALPGLRSNPARLALDAGGCLEPIAPVPLILSAGIGTTTCRLRASRRGRGRIDEAWLRFEGPLGLVSGTARAAVGLDLPVVPDLGPVRRDAIRFFRERDVRAGLKIERYRGDGTEFDSLREFVLGDDHRHVDWKASARHRLLLSRHFRAERNHQVVVAVDCGRLMAEPVGTLTRLDHALMAALLLGFIALASGDRVGAYSFGARAGPSLDPLGGLAAFPRLVRWSSEVAERPEETNFTLGLATLAGRLRRRSLVVVLTDFVDTVSAELMIENLDRLAQHHLVVFVSLRDATLAAIAGARPSDARALQRAVVTEALLAEREAVLLRLRRLGIGFVDADPGDVRPRLVERYLEVRQRERIG